MNAPNVSKPKGKLQQLKLANELASVQEDLAGELFLIHKGLETKPFVSNIKLIKNGFISYK